MAKLRTLKSALNAGELSPLLRGRMDVARYQNGLERCRNMLPLVGGGVTRRPGTRYVAEAAQTADVLLFPFVVSTSGTRIGYMLEFTTLKIRVYKDGAPVLSGGSPLEIVTTYTAEQLADIHFAANENSLYLAHPQHAPRRLLRTTDTDWTLENINIRKQPLRRPIGTEDITIQASATTGVVTLTASAALFHVGHVGVRISLSGALALITGYISPTQVAAVMVTPITSTTVTYRDTHTLTLTIDPATLSGVTTYTVTHWLGQTDVAASAGLFTAILTTVTPDDPLAGVSVDVTRNTAYDDGDGYHNGTLLARIVDTVTLVFDPALMAPGALVLTLTSAGDLVFPSPDPVLGMSHALFTIVHLARVFSKPASPAGIGVVHVTASATLNGLSIDLDWREQAWSDARGWPGGIAFSEQRLHLCGTDTWPTGHWASRIGDFTDWTPGAEDADPIDWSVADATSRLVHLTKTDTLLALSFDQEISLAGGNESPLTPTNPNIKIRTSNGTHPQVRPAHVGNSVYFASPSGKRLRSTQYLLETDAWESPDLAMLAEHLFEAGGVVDLAYTREPASVLWVVTSAGHLLGLSLDQEQQLVAWSRHFSGTETAADPPQYLSVCSVPGNDGQDVLWIAVRRKLAGVWRCCIEVLDSSRSTDSSLAGTNPAGSTYWNGLSHLNGLEVAILADGYVLPRQTVSGGELTLDYPAQQVEIGLPYTSILKDLPPYIEGAVGGQFSINQVRVLLHKSSGCSINGEIVPFQQFGDNLLDSPVQPFTGWKEVNACSGWCPDGDTAQVEIVQELPLPLTVLAIAKEVSVNG